MVKSSFVPCSLLLSMACTLVMAATPETVDLKRGVPSAAYLAVYSKYNPERDFQREYLDEIRATVEDTQIVQRALKIVSSRIPDDELKAAQSVFDQMTTALEPVAFDALWNCKETIYAQTMDEFTSQHLLLLRLPDESAAAYQKGIVNLFRLAERHADGKVHVDIDTNSPAQLTTMTLPGGAPFRPAVGHLGDVFILSSSADFARQSLDSLLKEDAKSKFDDPRFKEALAQLPAAEDSLVFYDGRQQFQQLREMLEGRAQKAGDGPEAERWLGIMGKIFDELSILDYEVTVEYTEENLNRSSTVGKLIPGTEDRLLAKVLGGGQAFEEWHGWVPADATSYSITTGANLHLLYEHVVKFVRENIPESHDALSQFEQWQEKNDLHIDRDILQAFSGECVSVSVPAEVPTLLSSTHEVLALRCQKPERIRELLHRLVDYLQQFPVVKAQQFGLTDLETLDGFEQLSATFFALFGAEPVIGFRDGWLICGSNADVVQRVLDTRAGKAPSVVGTEGFQKFRLDVDGPVKSVSYTDMARATRRAATLLNQAGAILPMIIGVMGAEVDAKDLESWQEVIGLLPSLGKIVAKFDFLEAKLSVTQGASQPGTYFRHHVTYVRPPTETE